MKLLKEWALEYLKAKDAFVKQIKNIEENTKECDVMLHYETHDRCVLVQDTIDADSVVKKAAAQPTYVVVPNTKENVELLLKNWDGFKEHKQLCFFFVNPNSKTEQKWMVYPSTHDSITEKNALRKGIESLFLTVEPYMTPEKRVSDTAAGN